MFIWDRVEEHPKGWSYTERMHVPGGTLWKVVEFNPDTGHTAVAITFVPEPEGS